MASTSCTPGIRVCTCATRTEPIRGNLSAVSGVPFAPRFSPDGRRLRFTIRDTNQRTSSLWEVSAEGKGLHPILPEWNKPPQEFGGAWTPNGEYFLFESTRDHTQNIWALREGTSSLFRKAGAEPTQLTVGPLLFSNPTPSLDGKKTVRDRPAAPLRSGPPGRQVAAVFHLTFRACRRARPTSCPTASGSPTLRIRNSRCGEASWTEVPAPSSRMRRCRCICRAGRRMEPRSRLWRRVRENRGRSSWCRPRAARRAK